MAPPRYDYRRGRPPLFLTNTLRLQVKSRISAVLRRRVKDRTEAALEGQMSLSALRYLGSSAGLPLLSLEETGISLSFTGRLHADGDLM